MGERKIKNMEEFAAVSGISRPTVSKYFNDPSSVRASTRARIEAALEEYEYTPNIYAMNQNRRLTKNVGIVVPFLTDPYFAEISRKIEALVTAAGFRAILLNSQGSPRSELENLDSLRQIKPAGVLLAPIGRVSDRDAVADFCADVPTLLFDSNLPEIGRAFVGSDSHQFTELMVEYLCRTGEPPAFFEMRTPANPNANRRRESYLQTMQNLGCTPQVIQIEGEGWAFEEIAFHEGLRILENRKIYSNTVLCSNDRLAIGFLAACYEKGLRVGRSNNSALRVAGMDDHPFSRYTCPALTTVAHDYNSVAENAVTSLMALIADHDTAPDPRTETVFAGQLIMRHSA